jgi:predicted RNase H-like HicB family nuclease
VNNNSKNIQYYNRGGIVKTYTFVTLKTEDNQYIGVVPEIPGIVAQSPNKDELSPRIKDAITAYIKTVRQEKLSSPQSLELIDVNEVTIENE